MKQEHHFAQAKNNLKFLEKANASALEFYDWQVTVCFYSALHIMSGHLKAKGVESSSHVSTLRALDPSNQLSITKLGEDEYVAYRSLYNLSRRARYLVEVNSQGIVTTGDTPLATRCVHLARSIRNLDRILAFLKTEYKVDLDKIKIKCSDLSQSDNLKFVAIQ
ncbi:hypothetical protein [Dyadobacter sp. CY312]|uniref:hypothetical protein n=1 Tax=Dyadobacter sp. CY312 TaxID=2907303 RepID=UPI001F28E43C|nr:hypothetical protein [Dyadobacter sp. CY312]MCE7038967.1 hypothetical protein [Dyadobacter sp. CY312]